MTAKIGGMRRRRRLPLRIVAARIVAILALATLPATAAGAASWGAAGGGISADRDYVAAVERLRAEDYPTAITLLEKLAERLPGNAEVFNYLGYTYRKAGRDAAALAAYQRALFLAPGDRRVRAELGALYLERGEVAAAEAQLAEIDNLCFFSCREYRELRAQIDDFKNQEAQRPGSGQDPVN
jgi:predicted Zn-dependent protease